MLWIPIFVILFVGASIFFSVMDDSKENDIRRRDKARVSERERDREIITPTMIESNETNRKVHMVRLALCSNGREGSTVTRTHWVLVLLIDIIHHISYLYFVIYFFD